MNQCTGCDTHFTPKRNTKGLYCSNACQMAYQHEQYITRWLRGDELGHGGKTADLSHHIYKFLHKTRGTACQECGWDKRHPVDDRVLTEVDHVDGDAHNCKPDNLKILCPNCHSMTSTFRARNIGSKRKR